MRIELNHRNQFTIQINIFKISDNETKTIFRAKPNEAHACECPIMILVKHDKKRTNRKRKEMAKNKSENVKSKKKHLKTRCFSRSRNK